MAASSSKDGDKKMEYEVVPDLVPDPEDQEPQIQKSLKTFGAPMPPSSDEDEEQAPLVDAADTNKPKRIGWKCEWIKGGTI